MPTTDNFKQMLQSDGEAIVAGDMNDQQRFLAARLMDQVLAALAPNFSPVGSATADPPFTGQLGVDMPSTPYAYALTVGGAYLRQGSTNNKVQIAPGTLLQKIAAANGNEETLIAYTFAGTEEVAIANGDPVNPRVDIVQMKLEFVEGDNQLRDFEDAVTDAPSTGGTNKKRRVQCTLSVKQGAAAASPAYPAPDAGCVVIAGVVVGATYAAANPFKFEDTGGAEAVIHDQRMPLRVRAQHSLPKDFIYGADYSQQTGGFDVAKANANAGSRLVMPYRGPLGRLIAISNIWGTPAAITLTAKISKHSWSDFGGAANQVITDLASHNAGGTTGFKRRSGGLLGFQQSAFALFAVGPVVQANANGMGAPIWTNGKRAPTEDLRTGVDPIPYPFLALTYVGQVNDNGTQYGPATFFVAEGL